MLHWVTPGCVSSAFSSRRIIIIGEIAESYRAGPLVLGIFPETERQ